MLTFDVDIPFAEWIRCAIRTSGSQIVSLFDEDMEFSFVWLICKLFAPSVARLWRRILEGQKYVSPIDVLVIADFQLNKRHLKLGIFCLTITSVYLTLSCSGYHLSPGVSKTSWPKGRVTSPRKSLRPKMSECQTLSHRSRVSTSLIVI